MPSTKVTSTKSLSIGAGVNSTSKAVNTAVEARKVVRIRHPGYPDHANVLLELAGYDAGTGGIHQGFALLLCAIITGNRTDGWLDHRRVSTPPKKSLDVDNILRGEDFYFHLPNTKSAYAVVPTFDHWRFPHVDAGESHPLDKLFSRTSAAALPFYDSDDPRSVETIVNERDQGCVITRMGDYCDTVNLLPSQHRDWFEKNQMGRYAACGQTPSSGTTDAWNTITLRPDIARAFEDGKFVFAQKAGELVVQSISPTRTGALNKVLHNVGVPSGALNGVHPVFLLVRIAVVAFRLVRPFFDTSIQRKVHFDSGKCIIMGRLGLGSSASQPSQLSEIDSKEEVPFLTESSEFTESDSWMRRGSARNWHLVPGASRKRSRGDDDDDVTQRATTRAKRLKHEAIDKKEKKKRQAWDNIRNTAKDMVRVQRWLQDGHDEATANVTATTDPNEQPNAFQDLAATIATSAYQTEPVAPHRNPRQYAPEVGVKGESYRTEERRMARNRKIERRR